MRKRWSNYDYGTHRLVNTDSHAVEIYGPDRDRIARIIQRALNRVRRASEEGEGNE